MRWNLVPFARGAQPPTREGPQGPTGPTGWVGGWADVQTGPRGRPQIPTHSTLPAGGLRGPLRWYLGPRGSGPLALGDLVLPTRYTHPVHPCLYPGPVHPPDQCTVWTMHGTTGTCTYDRFETRVGEPRGIGTHPYSGSQAGYTRFRGITRPFDWVLHCFGTVLALFRPHLALFRPHLALFRPHFTEFRTCFTEFRIL